jgi:hypothetical protein
MPFAPDIRNKQLNDPRFNNQQGKTVKCGLALHHFKEVKFEKSFH